ncbi:MAG: hypothetical protein JWM09_1065 [Francisellaceae bacterium]|nr:hypothetical protein [Francisellaceae bacterium]
MLADEKARQEALNVSKSFIVEAPAGSGKTALLIQRFLALLLTADKEPEECLAITFTKKAAQEMRDRILASLRDAEASIPINNPYEHETRQLANSLLKKDQNLQWNLLDNPNRLKIQTVDALCASLTRQMPIISQFGAFPEVLENTYPLYEKAARSFLQHINTATELTASFYTLLSHLDNNLIMIKKLLAEMLPLREQWLPYLAFNYTSAERRTLLEQGLKMINQEILNDLNQAFPKSLKEEFINLANFSGSHCRDSNLIPLLKTVTLKDLNSKLDNLAYWKAIAELCLTKEGSIRKSVSIKIGFPSAAAANTVDQKKLFIDYKNRIKDFLEKIEGIEPLIKNLQNLSQFPALSYTALEWNIIESLSNLLPNLAAELQLIFRERGQVDFTEISIAACRALGELDSPSDLALSLDYKIKHILVDEFQDTSIPQARLLSLLTAGWEPNDGRTLFLVGDPKQSIYRFRQAEVGLFISTKHKGINHLPLESLKLTVNFRTHPQIINWLNPIFAEAFPKYEDISSGAIPFNAQTPGIQGHEAKHIQAEIHPFINDEQAEIGKVIDLIKAIREKEPDGSIAILVRSRPHLKPLLPALREADISYMGVDIEPLNRTQAVLDTFSLTRALLHLSDRVAWLALLRSPLVGIKLTDLLAISQTAIDKALWNGLKNLKKIDNLSLDAVTRLNRVFPILENALELKDRIPLSEWVNNTWQALGGEYILLTPLEQESVKAYFQLLEDDEIIRNRYDVEFLENRLKLLFSPIISTNNNPVHIMTIHKSKGLEFDTVIMPGLGKKSAIDKDKLLLWQNKTNALGQEYLLFAPIKEHGKKTNSIYNYIKKNQEISHFHETLRLLYVGSTRAKNRLHWLANIELGKNKELLKAPPNSMLSFVWESVKPFFYKILEKNNKEDIQEGISNISNNVYQPLTLKALPIDFRFSDKTELFKLSNINTLHPQKQKLALTPPQTITEILMQKSYDKIIVQSLYNSKDLVTDLERFIDVLKEENKIIIKQALINTQNNKIIKNKLHKDHTSGRSDVIVTGMLKQKFIEMDLQYIKMHNDIIEVFEWCIYSKERVFEQVVESIKIYIGIKYDILNLLYPNKKINILIYFPIQDFILDI